MRGATCRRVRSRRLRHELTLVANPAGDATGVLATGVRSDGVRGLCPQHALDSMASRGKKVGQYHLRWPSLLLGLGTHDELVVSISDGTTRQTLDVTVQLPIVDAPVSFERVMNSAQSPWSAYAFETPPYRLR